MVFLNSFWTDYVMLVADTGRKRIYNNSAKADDYTISSLKNRIRQMRPRDGREPEAGNQ